MTRYTNFGRKRTYVQASFDPNDDQTTTNAAASTSALDSRALDVSCASFESSVNAPPEPDRKRRRKSKENSGENVAAESAPGVTVAGGENKKNSQATKTERERKKKLARLKAKEKAKRAKTIADRAASSESRRVKRIAARRVHTTCFACREVGHSAKDCPSISVPRPNGEEDDDDDDDDKGGGTTHAKIEAVVGMCYRCGSGKHNLAQCRQRAPPDGALPFASCFVCSGRGHLAGSCPRNNGKGVYPNGGACKLCGETTHLAKNCTLRKIEGNAVATLLGTGREAGADEDDFHTIRRKNAEIDWHEHGEERARKEAKVGTGALTGVVKAFGKAPARPKKVVSF